MAFDMDKVVAWLVNRAIKKASRVPFQTWHPGEKLKVLLVGYTGKESAGGDARGGSIAEQFYSVLGKENIEIGCLTLNPEKSRLYFPSPTRLIEFNSFFFNAVLRACSEYHIGVISEGNTLMSNYANSLTLFFVEACGVMKQQQKPCLAYGCEAGKMDDFVCEIAGQHCDQTYFIGRTQPSLEIVKEMGLKGELGTDTAWIFPPAPREWAERELREKAGWDGKKPLVGVAVTNPFWWPIKPGLTKWFSGYGRRHPEEHYQKWYFVTYSEEKKRLFTNYLNGIVRAVDEFARRHNTQVIIFGMEGFDWDATMRLQEMLKTPGQIFSSRFYNAYQMSALLRKLSMLITSDYHGRVLSMPAGVPSIAISMDEKLYNLLKETGHLEDYFLKTDEPQLGEKLTVAMKNLWENREQVRAEVTRTIPGYLKKMAGMGKTFRNFVKKNFPEFPLPPEPKDWQGYLPPLYPELDRIVKENL